ncbi:polysaccharide biosynthesis C-terminal domain-containing protein [Oceanihabitans sediminis]|uniref:MATE family efflux transporter n=1 Tax=Oceanihabitans sediminis TaxID=1812012 RepID=UPI00299CF098|nr:polysaccharide biosynthesis C-terminal domain-containing protein [Oceanihabitans sediminis]MDX1773703.1 polysaccharide biosynthesis C-terminal domain-containing protein [Oceanihabitans sediminis]
MGIVASQSIKNTIITYLGFGIGAINTLFLYTQFLTADYFGLIVFILSTANIMMPLLMFGVNNSLIKFYSSYKTRKHQNNFLTFMLFLPFLVIIPVGLIGSLFYDTIASWLAKENHIIKDYTWLIYVLAVALAYFEVFFSWSKIHFKSVFGNFMREAFHRVGTMVLLLAVYYEKLSVEEFIYALSFVYILRMLIMKIYAFSIRFPKLYLNTNFDYLNVLKYSFLIIIAGSVSMLLLDLDKFMLGELIELENIAYYTVAIFIATVIAVPARAMHQIVNPLTASLLNDKKKKELEKLYKTSSITLFIIGGFIFILIIININQLYTLMNPEYSQGLFIVFIISIVKLIDNLLGNNNAIIFNSNYYRIILVFGFCIVILAVLLNYLLIPKYGIEGAAVASLIAFLVYDFLKLWYVNLKFKMHPFSGKTIHTLVLITVFCLAFYFWEFPFHAIINIALKSILAGIAYAFIVFKFSLSEDLNTIFKKVFKLR